MYNAYYIYMYKLHIHIFYTSCCAARFKQRGLSNVSIRHLMFMFIVMSIYMFIFILMSMFMLYYVFL